MSALSLTFVDTRGVEFFGMGYGWNVVARDRLGQKIYSKIHKFRPLNIYFKIQFVLIYLKQDKTLDHEASRTRLAWTDPPAADCALDNCRT